MELNKIILGDCLIKLKELEDNSVDSIVTDPPYGIGFMGKKWDTFKQERRTKNQVVNMGSGMAFPKPAEMKEFQDWCELWARECLRVLKPGGHLLAFSGTRTYHRMAVAIEDAGFEVRDMIEWVYGSGFPKSLNIGKAVDKIAPRLGQFDEFAKHLTEQIKKSGKTQKEISILFPSKTGGLTGCVWNWANGANVPTVAQWNILKPLLDLSDDFLSLIERIEREREVVGKGADYGHQEEKDIDQEFGFKADYNITKGTSEWEGWGTALKPAHEPICMARKPLAEKTVAENCLKWGTGGINIDESRVGTDGGTAKGTFPNEDSNGIYGNGLNGACEIKDIGMGRFPANLITDGSEEVRECFPETNPSKSAKMGAGLVEGIASMNLSKKAVDFESIRGFDDNGGNASRFFKSIIYQAKASKSERNKGCEGLEDKPKVFNGQSDKPSEDMKDVEKRFTTLPKANNHPTVKPIALMEYLIKMVTPKGGIVLDPFAGSGSTLIAAKQNGFQYIGIEMTEEYIPIIEARLKAVKQQTLL